MNKLRIAFAMFLVFAMTISLVALPTAHAWDDATAAAVTEGMRWDFPGAENYNASYIRLRVWERYQDKIPTVVYCVLSPNPVGVGQEITLLLFNPIYTPAMYDFNDVRNEFSVEITDPDGETTRLPTTGTIKSDPTGAAYTMYTPTKVGNYSITVKFHELFYKWYGGWAEAYKRYQYNDYYGATFLESTSTYTLVVQEDPVLPTAVTNYPLPTEYWTRPIEGQNNAWGQVSSNWLGSAKDTNYGSTQNRYQTEGIAPNSAHILWTKPIEDGGVVGGDKYFSSPGETFSGGCPPYQPRMTKQIIMHGRLYYELPISFSDGGGGWICVDLRTGEEIWHGNMGVAGSGMYDISFGYYYDFDTMNQHGVVNPGWLFAESGNTWYSVQPLTGTYGQLNITNVPSGTEVIGPDGEVLRYVIQNAGTAENPDWRLLQWNSSKKTPKELIYCYQADLGEFDAQGDYDWNVSLPIANGLTGSITPIAAIYDDVLLCNNGTLYSIDRLIDPTRNTYYAAPDTATLWAVSLKPESRGQTLFGPTNYKMAGIFRYFVRAGEGVFMMLDLPSYTWSGYSMYTGEKLWESDPETEINPLGFYSYTYSQGYCTSIADGKFYSTGYSGHVLCYDLYNGSLLWSYAAPTNAAIIDYYTLINGVIADGKIYVGAYEHSPDTPLYKGERVRCLNTTTGEEIWTMLGYPQMNTIAIADGVLIYLNQYDSQVYAVGKGPSSTTVTAGPKVSVHGNKLLVEGTVMDISAGTKQDEQAARFPNGVPAVSEASMSEWMEYVYQQKPKPTNVTGVEVIISVLDPNNNCYEVGRTTGDADGFFKLSFEPEVPGEYTVVATFAGSESYWPSHAETALYVEEAPAATPVPTPVPQEPVGTYFTISTVLIIAAIAIVAFLILRRR